MVEEGCTTSLGGTAAPKRLVARPRLEYTCTRRRIEPMHVRVAAAKDLDAVAECLVAAFATDPVWSVALRRSDDRTDHHLAYWRLFVQGAARFDSVFVADDVAAVSIWLPPDADELDATGLADLEHLLTQSLDGPTNAAIHELYQRFEASRAATPGPHRYLSLLATDPVYRGRGIGQALLAADLARWDRDGVPAYLESTNPANDHRYERAGFRSIGGFSAVLDHAWVNAMWRPLSGADAG
jgi:GNAT superfamily N-acetyltransferase